MNDMQKNGAEAAASPVVNERAAKAASSYKNLYEIIKTLRAPGAVRGTGNKRRLRCGQLFWKKPMKRWKR